MARPPLKATGARGSWFATVEGVRYACLHKHWMGAKGEYLEPAYDAEVLKWREYRAALVEKGMAILTDDRVVDGQPFERSGYIALFRIKDIEEVEDGLRMRLVERLEELK